ncbi:AraC-like DNA-binding protein [Actinoplanes octamycinicus]|uniref:AraC-like DNA-binding protein n=1 Tax=Actinoplanes octamycinicus TaxID=135948 RepID=A0A7W7H0X0_9ACTN|nr:AraC family transcriptional regulator [Actinoplanes octamycinicus]MBB4741878.1 AraC-like DNA-binding protein [Actinoplanes octamycinicus]GIE60641.1 hypothetical protein Aoc01nite_60430 [Actinoplanes octamycinicus]
MTDGFPGAGLTPVRRAELVTADMDQIADLVRQLYLQHTASFRCPDPARVEGRAQSATVAGLTAGVLGYDGFTYSLTSGPTDSAMAFLATKGGGAVTSGGEELAMASGRAYLYPTERPAACHQLHGDWLALRVSWDAVVDLAEEQTGLPGDALRFEAMGPVSADAERFLAGTAEFLCGQLVTARPGGISPLLAAAWTRVVAGALLHTFPNTAMTAYYLRGPSRVPAATVRAAAEFIQAHADQPVTGAQIAAAAGVDAHGLQHAFRREHGTTLDSYLRRVRLERAHQELTAADPAGGTTVAAVATRWGWAGPARFTDAYRERFGVLPDDTLCR